MTEQSSEEQTTRRWYTRPVLFVADISRALRFYVDVLGFQKAWHEADGAGKVCQVNRAECEIILCENADRKDKARRLLSSQAMVSRSFAGRSSSARFLARNLGGAMT
jgi:catechol 2,3-dioxygenase-like lactoylglutathione lyase family enzyme